MICTNCGARISKKADRCPHCNAMIYAGAESKYMGQLESIKTEMVDISKRPTNVWLHRLGFVVCIVAGIISVMLIAMVVKEQREAADFKKEEMEYEEEFAKKLLWEDETYPKLDGWYEQGDYNSIITFRDSLYSDAYGHNFGSWRHAAFIEVYEKYAELLMFEDSISKGEYTQSYEYGNALYQAMSLWYYYDEEHLKSMTPQNEFNADWGLTEKEIELIDGYRNKAYQFMTVELHITDQELEKLIQQSENNNIAGACYDYVEERY